MQENNANRNPEWDAVLGDDTMTGTQRLLAIFILFIALGGSIFHFLR